MTARHWAWVAAGLLTWALVVWLWSTSPTQCPIPADHVVVAC